jgi:hypothetical protein
MNPYTRSLLVNIQYPELERFVGLWDAFESLAIEVYRRGDCTQDDSRDYRRLAADLRSTYPDWEEALAPYWQASRIKGEGEIRNPFTALLEIEECSLWISNQGSLKLLPAAREAINRFLLSLRADGPGA